MGEVGPNLHPTPNLVSLPSFLLPHPGTLTPNFSLSCTSLWKSKKRRGTPLGREKLGLESVAGRLGVLSLGGWDGGYGGEAPAVPRQLIPLLGSKEK